VPGRDMRIAKPIAQICWPMLELLRTNDVVRLSWVRALLADAGIESLVLDEHTSLVEGSIGAIPRRLMVSDEDLVRARQLLEAADGKT
jgi:hypothetical protein